MKTIHVGLACGAAILCLSATLAMSEDRLSGKVSVTALSGNCPSALSEADGAIPVDFVLPDTAAPAHPPVQNRFRYNYLDPQHPVNSVTITGQIANYGTPGCTVAFQGQAASLD